MEPHTDGEGAFDRAETTFRDRIRDDPDARFRQRGPRVRRRRAA